MDNAPAPHLRRRFAPGEFIPPKLCPFRAPDDIPRDVLAAGAEFLPEPLRATVSDALAFDDAVSAIRRYSLIETGGDTTLSLHRLVQAVIRDRLDAPGLQRWAEAALNVVNKAFPVDSDDVLMWKAVARDIDSLGSVLEALGDSPGAKAAYERALAILQKSLGDDHPNARLVRENLDSLPS